MTRVPAHFGNPNVLAGWLEIVLPVVVAFILTSKKKKEFIVLLITAIIGYLVLLLTFSRGGFLTGFGALGLIMIFKIRNKIVSAVIITVFVLAIILGSGFLIRQLTVFSYEEMESDTSTLRRIVQYANYWWMMEKYPVLGIGWGARLMYHDYGTFERSHQPGFAYGHLNSSFFDFGVHNGFIGIFAFYSLIIAIIYNFWKNSRTIDHKRLAMFSWCLALGMLSFMAHSFLDGFYKSSTFSCHFWLLVGLGFAARIVWDRYGDKIDNADRFRFQIVNPFQKYLRKP
ncbi:MAG: hypothetical protein GY771_04245 [bacterium]|nr:hypothetical protein [bacterium]